MSNPNARIWARHFQDVWLARAGDTRLPYWLRVASLAFGSHGDNGHARFRRGEIAQILGGIDRETGEVRPFTNVGREIGRAVEYGFLVDGSYWGCLIVPAHSIKKGYYGPRSAPCPLAPKHKERSANRSLGERNDLTSSTPVERFEARTAHSVSGLQRESLLSVLSPVRQDRNPNPKQPRRSA